MWNAWMDFHQVLRVCGTWPDGLCMLSRFWSVKGRWVGSPHKDSDMFSGIAAHEENSVARTSRMYQIY